MYIVGYDMNVINEIDESNDFVHGSFINTSKYIVVSSVSSDLSKDIPLVTFDVPDQNHSD